MGANVTKVESENLQRVVDRTTQRCPSVSGTNEIKNVRVVVKRGLTGDINFNQSAVLDTQCVMKTFQEATLKALETNKTDAGTALGFNYLDLKSKTNQEIVNETIQDCGKIQATKNTISGVDVLIDSETPMKDLNFSQSLDVRSACSLDKMSKAIASLDKNMETTSGISGSALAFGLGSVAVICLVGVGIYLVVKSGGGGGGGGYSQPYMPPQQSSMYSQPNMYGQAQSPYQTQQPMQQFGNQAQQYSTSPQVNMTQSSTSGSPSSLSTKTLPPIPQPISPSITASSKPVMNNRPTYVPSTYSPQTPINPRGSPQIY